LNLENRQKIIKYLFSLLKDVQKEMFELVYSNKKSRKYIIHCARRLGKTFLLIIISCCVAYSKNNAQVRYASVSQKAVRKMVHPIFKEIFKTIKKNLRPRWNSQEGAYILPNGSMIHIAGCNNGHADDLRGTAADLCVVDEAAFVDDLSYLVDSVLMPQLLTVPDSMLLMASSSPVSPAHEFVDYINDAKINGYYSCFDIYKGGYSSDLIEEFCEEAGGEDSTTWLREYLNKIVIDDDYAIIPEAKNFKAGIEPTSYRDFYRNYVSMDIGTKDLTVALFGYYDFKRAKLCIEKEFVINGPKMTTPIIAEGISKIEQELFKPNSDTYRIADNNNLLLLQDLGFLHNCHFSPTSKDSLDAMVNEMRIWFKNDRIEISEQCQTLIESIMFGYWNEQRSGFGRSNTLGHFDAIAALMYMIRNIDQTTNPIPVVAKFDQVLIEDSNSVHNELANILKF
jgi:hypothetical protein